MADYLDLLFPGKLYCSCCGNIIDQTRTYGLCDFCLENFRWNLKEPEVKDGIKYISCVEYGLLEKSLIFRLKYSGDKYIAKTIAEIMRDKLNAVEGMGVHLFTRDEEDEKKPAVIPIPLYRKKERERGFNQAALIGKHLAKMMDMEFLPGALVRTKETRAMRGLSEPERRANIRGTIKLNPRYFDEIKGRRILLLDDFFTTGSTGEAAIEGLLEGSPKEMAFMVYAKRTPYKIEYRVGDNPME